MEVILPHKSERSFSCDCNSRNYFSFKRISNQRLKKCTKQADQSVCKIISNNNQYWKCRLSRPKFGLLGQPNIRSMEAAMTVKQLAEIAKAKDRARMLRGEEWPRQEAFVNWYGDVDWDLYHDAWAAYNARRAA
jgi:hypothetical protein